MPFRALPPQGSASTNFATTAQIDNPNLANLALAVKLLLRSLAFFAFLYDVSDEVDFSV